MEKNTEPHTLQAVPVQDRTTRWFHWINVLCVLGLVWGVHRQSIRLLAPCIARGRGYLAELKACLRGMKTDLLLRYRVNFISTDESRLLQKITNCNRSLVDNCRLGPA